MRLRKTGWLLLLRGIAAIAFGVLAFVWPGLTLLTLTFLWGAYALGAPLNKDDPTTYYGGGAKGYTDYPSLAQERGEQPKSCVDQSWR